MWHTQTRHSVSMPAKCGKNRALVKIDFKHEKHKKGPIIQRRLPAKCEKLRAPVQIGQTQEVQEGEADLCSVGGGDAGDAAVADDERPADAAAVRGYVNAVLLQEDGHKLTHASSTPQPPELLHQPLGPPVNAQDASVQEHHRHPPIKASIELLSPCSSIIIIIITRLSC